MPLTRDAMPLTHDAMPLTHDAMPLTTPHQMGACITERDTNGQSAAQCDETNPRYW